MYSSSLQAILRLVASAGVAAVLLGSARSQEDEDPEIAELETAYRSELVEIRDDLGKKWLSALANLRDERTRDQKFAEALLVRGEIKRVEALLKADPLPGPATKAVDKLTLLPQDAILSAPLRLANKAESIGSWSLVGASASWEIPADITPGTYELILHFQAGADGGGSLKVEVGDEQTLSGEITAAKAKSEGWKVRRAVLIGECVLDEHTGKLTISSTAHNGSELMNLNSIDLAPQGSWAEMESAPPGSRTGAAPEKPRAFEKLVGARWIDSDSRQSGEFVVIHGGSEHRFRLYFVDLPPTAVPASRFGKAELERTARQLRTTEDKLVRFGKKVDAGLRDAVWTEDLTIYTRWEKRGREGAYLAYILVGDTPLSLLLVEEGHARVGRSFAAEAPFIAQGKGSAKVYLNRLRAAELAAKQSRRGLWGL